MAKNRLTDLRDHLFATLEDLRDPDNPMDLERAKVVAQVADRIIDSAKVEVEYVEAVGELLGQTVPLSDFITGNGNGKTIDMKNGHAALGTGKSE